MTLNAIHKNDPADMYSAIATISDQVRDAIAIGDSVKPLGKGSIRRIAILGMGGSAIGGDLLRSYIHAFADHGGVDISIHRGYDAPSVDKHTLVIASSYSGTTEETLSAYEGAYRNAGRTVVITTGGTLAANAAANKQTAVIIPSGLQPRAALAYSFFPLLWWLGVRSQLFGPTVATAITESVEETIGLLKKLAKKYGSGDASGNSAYKLASQLRNKIPVIYSAQDRLDTINLRWRGQIQENAKQVAFGNLLPEMNHNEINGWSYPKSLLKHFAVVFLRDADDHTRVKTRLDFTRKVIAGSAGLAVNVSSQGKSLLARMFSLIHLGDWVSYYLAAMNSTDPSPVPVIQKLKKHLNQS